MQQKHPRTHNINNIWTRIKINVRIKSQLTVTVVYFILICIVFGCSLCLLFLTSTCECAPRAPPSAWILLGSPPCFYCVIVMRVSFLSMWNVSLLFNADGLRMSIVPFCLVIYLKHWIPCVMDNSAVLLCFVYGSVFSSSWWRRRISPRTTPVV